MAAALWSPSGPATIPPGGVFWMAVAIARVVPKLLALTTSLAGGFIEHGSAAVSQQKLVSALAGVMQPQGTISVADQKLITALTGGQTDAGAVAQALKQLTAALTAAQTQSGGAAAALPDLLTSLAGTQTQAAAVATNLPPTTSALTGVMQPQGTIAVAALKLISTLVAGQTQIGTVAASLHQLACALAGAQTEAGVLAAPLFTPNTSLAGAQTQSGSVGASLGLELASIIGGQAQSGAIVTLEPGPTTALSGLSVDASESGVVAAALPGLLAANVEAAQTQSGIVVSTLPAAFWSDIEAAQIQSAAVAATLKSHTAALVGVEWETGTIGGALLPGNTALSGTDVPQVLFDAVGAGVASEKAGGGTWTYLHTMAGNAIVVLANVFNNGVTSPTIGATVGGLTMALLAQYNYYTSGSTGAAIYIYGYLGALTGAETIGFTFDGSGSSEVACSVNSLSYLNASSFGTVAENKGTTTSASLAVPSTTAPQRIAQIFGIEPASTSSFSGYNQTSRWNQAGVSGTAKATIIGDAAGNGATVNFTATSPASGAWGGAAVPILPAT